MKVLFTCSIKFKTLLTQLFLIGPLFWRLGAPPSSDRTTLWTSPIYWWVHIPLRNHAKQQPDRHKGSELKLAPSESLEESSTERISLKHSGKCYKRILANAKSEYRFTCLLRVVLVYPMESTKVVNSSHGGYCLTRLKSQTT